MNEVPKLGSGNYPANVRFWVNIYRSTLQKLSINLASLSVPLRYARSHR
ncbi:hypothetical protein C8J46_11128 [Sphingomonas sp. PP-F2F-A104-K0414]|nr:hypothetical protein C8J46_11128 [Sphingomonas sp. PP-F2F-A104-K0414]